MSKQIIASAVAALLAFGFVSSASAQLAMPKPVEISAAAPSKDEVGARLKGLGGTLVSGTTATADRFSAAAPVTGAALGNAFETALLTGANLLVAGASQKEALSTGLTTVGQVGAKTVGVAGATIGWGLDASGNAVSTTKAK